MVATQIFETQLNFVAGYYGRGMLQKVVLVKSTEKANAVAGRCGYLDSNGEWVAGPPPAKKGPPFWVWRGTNQPDTLNDGTGADGTKYWVAGNTRGFITCFAGLGGFEFQTTEFETGSTYANGDALTVTAAGKVDVTAAEPFGTTAIVGFATPFQGYPENLQPASTARTPTGTNLHNRSVLNFHTCFYAARSA